MVLHLSSVFTWWAMITRNKTRQDKETCSVFKEASVCNVTVTKQTKFFFHVIAKKSHYYRFFLVRIIDTFYFQIFRSFFAKSIIFGSRSDLRLTFAFKSANKSHHKAVKSFATTAFLRLHPLIVRPAPVLETSSSYSTSCDQCGTTSQGTRLNCCELLMIDENPV